jgi:hypothetical protein
VDKGDVLEEDIMGPDDPESELKCVFFSFFLCLSPLTWLSSRSRSQDLDAERVMESKKEVGRSQIILSMH